MSFMIHDLAIVGFANLLLPLPGTNVFKCRTLITDRQFQFGSLCGLLNTWLHRSRYDFCISQSANTCAINYFVFCI